MPLQALPKLIQMLWMFLCFDNTTKWLWTQFVKLRPLIAKKFYLKDTECRPPSAKLYD
ncbi:uncharacterized protein PHALS_10690 [Plasmopara halstedii]|uniref:Uncharacterized protein n=1 Tax=Plasmopara halstedii TaxID=4781 RepID=A0A0P1AGZ6_PLAHL|nr:uncharacterized protein PHALS_10690 [Plasmopara halstedii]CEG40495.1 hypothetical protein PHALS_10690 [Plasmopara halstedii]|eukprot:XP_024576864.1 hypothetical protein PHALS_10690 [Plasmopara halstedii]